jgi:GNAT superfamily N-acetyltransferase
LLLPVVGNHLYWQVFLVRRGDETVGVAGLYRQPGMAKDTCWIGWLGVRPAFRRQVIGTSTIQNLIAAAQNIGCKTLWVYTGAEDQIAIQFYQKVGFAVVGPAGQSAPGQTMNDSDIVLNKVI